MICTNLSWWNGRSNSSSISTKRMFSNMALCKKLWIENFGKNTETRAPDMSPELCVCR